MISRTLEVNSNENTPKSSNKTTNVIIDNVMPIQSL